MDATERNTNRANLDWEDEAAFAWLDEAARYDRTLLLDWNCAGPEAADRNLNGDQVIRLAAIFSTEVATVRRMTLSNIAPHRDA